MISPPKLHQRYLLPRRRRYHRLRAARRITGRPRPPAIGVSLSVTARFEKSFTHASASAYAVISRLTREVLELRIVHFISRRGAGASRRQYGRSQKAGALLPLGLSSRKDARTSRRKHFA